MIVYLAGGFKSGWQDIFIQELGNHINLIDPRNFYRVEGTDYIEKELDAISRSDVVVGKGESDNPGGYALALELGVAIGLGKTTIFIDDENITRYFDMVRGAVDFVVFSDEEAIKLVREGLQA